MVGIPPVWLIGLAAALSHSQGVAGAIETPSHVWMQQRNKKIAKSLCGEGSGWGRIAAAWPGSEHQPAAHT